MLQVIDIEEMAWAPKYGLKGMIDASVRVKIQSQKDEQEEKIMPVEFKTGKTPQASSGPNFYSTIKNEIRQIL